MKKKTLVVVLAGILLLTGVVTASGGYQTIRVYKDKVMLLINGQNSSKSLNAMIYEGTVYLPIREIGENMGGKVTWNSTDHSVNLDFVVSTGDTVIAYADYAIYHYIAVEKNQIMKQFVESLQSAKKYAGLYEVMDRFRALEELADGIGDEELKKMLDKLAFSTEVIRSTLTANKSKDYALARQLFLDTEAEFSTHIEMKLSALRLTTP